MRALTASENEVAGALALALADAMRLALPSLFAEPAEAVVAVTLPVAESLVRAEIKAARNKKDARKHRKLNREVREMLRTQREAPARKVELANTIAFDPAGWHTELKLGGGHDYVLAGDGQ